MPLIRPTKEARQIIAAPDGWELYHLPFPLSFLWHPFKLIAPPGTERRRGARRSYMLAWNPDECRLAASSDANALKEQRPELHAGVVLLLDMTFDRAWLLGQYDEDEIHVERARLKAMRAANTRGSAASGT